MQQNLVGHKQRISTFFMASQQWPYSYSEIETSTVATLLLAWDGNKTKDEDVEVTHTIVLIERTYQGTQYDYQLREEILVKE
jgi:hypothetical protein